MPRKASLIGLLVLLAPLAAAQQAPPPFHGDFEGEFAAFEAADRAHPPADGAVLFMGSSSIYRWDGLEAAFPGVVDAAHVVKQGVLGAHITDFDDAAVVARLIAPYRWRHVVFYAGDNDIGEDRLDPEGLAAEFLRFVAQVHSVLPGVPITFVAIKPAPSRWSDHWRRIEDANCLVRRAAAEDPSVTYVDAMTPLLEHPMNGAVDKLACPEVVGEPIKADFDKDELHLNAAGYRLWARLLAPVLASDRLTKALSTPAFNQLRESR